MNAPVLKRAPVHGVRNIWIVSTEHVRSDTLKALQIALDKREGLLFTLFAYDSWGEDDLIFHIDQAELPNQIADMVAAGYFDLARLLEEALRLGNVDYIHLNDYCASYDTMPRY